MTKDIWMNLPVKDTARSKTFFAKLGFSFNEQRSNENMLCLVIGEKNVVVNLFKEQIFEGFTGAKAIDTKQGTEVLFSFSAESREDVDAMMQKAADAGGTIFGRPAEAQGWMYGGGFADLDGHRWNVLYMDMAKMPK